MFSNRPNMHNEENENLIRRFVHSPLAIEHHGIHAKIQENGRILITGAPVTNKETQEIEYDEVDIPASLVFKLATLLKATRREEFVSISDSNHTQKG